MAYETFETPSNDVTGQFELSAAFDALQRFVAGAPMTVEEAGQIAADPSCVALASQWEIA